MIGRATSPPLPTATLSAPRLWALYCGAFLGPFGGAMVSPMLPEMAANLGTDVQRAGLSLTTYLVPFAVAMTFSGTLAERWGRRRTLLVAYVGYAAAAMLCAVAPNLSFLLASRSLQGLANAFTSPVLLALLADRTPAGGLGRTLGRYGSLQAAGQSFAPLVGGAAAAIEWRLAFVFTIAAALALAALLPADVEGPRPEPGNAAAGRVIALWNVRLLSACGAAFLLHVTVTGLLLLGALHGAERFDLRPELRGLVVAAFGFSGLVAGESSGRAVDRYGLRSLGVVAAVSLAAAAAGAGVSATVVGLIVCLALGGAASTASRVVVNAMAATSTPRNAGGAMSLMLALQFLGGAVAPIALIPIYTSHAALGFIAAAIGAALAAVVLVSRAPGRLAPVHAA